VPLDGFGDGRQFPPPSDKPGDLGRKIILPLAQWQHGHDFPRIMRPAHGEGVAGIRVVSGIVQRRPPPRTSQSAISNYLPPLNSPCSR
jgi:hypothetical protein